MKEYAKEAGNYSIIHSIGLPDNLSHQQKGSFYYVDPFERAWLNNAVDKNISLIEDGKAKIIIDKKLYEKYQPKEMYIGSDKTLYFNSNGYIFSFKNGQAKKITGCSVYPFVHFIVFSDGSVLSSQMVGRPLYYKNGSFSESLMDFAFYDAQNKKYYHLFDKKLFVEGGKTYIIDGSCADEILGIDREDNVYTFDDYRSCNPDYSGLMKITNINTGKVQNKYFLRNIKPLFVNKDKSIYLEKKEKGSVALVITRLDK